MADPNLNTGEKSSNSVNIGDAMSKLNSGDIGKKIEEIMGNEELMGQLSDVMSSNPDLAAMAPKMAGDPRVNQFLQDNPDMNRKKALEMKKQMNKTAYLKRQKMAKVEGCLINAGRKLKPVVIVLNNGEPDLKEIVSHIGGKHVNKKEIDNYVVYYDDESKVRNKRVTKSLGNDITGGMVIVLAKEGNLSVANFEKFEKS